MGLFSNAKLDVSENKISWQVCRATQNSASWLTIRAKVPGGWLVGGTGGNLKGLCFYPDPEHKWDGGSLA
jgi:hypothetical protein